MENRGLFESIAGWFKKIFQLLFPEDVLEMFGTDRQAGSGQEEMTDLCEPDRERKEQMKNTPAERRHIRFFGRVQGVGFRYQAMYSARNFELTGWVKNLSDGSVEMEIQGPSAAIDYVILNIQNGRWIRIDAMESSVIPVIEGERGFNVRGY